MNKKTLVIATTSYAGMGPYVSEVVNSFGYGDSIYFFFYETEDLCFSKNIKPELKSKCIFYKFDDSWLNKLKYLLFKRMTAHQQILRFCKEENIDVVHFINGPGNLLLLKDLKKMGIKTISTIHDLHPHEAKKEWYKMIRMRILNSMLLKSVKFDSHFITNSKIQYKEFQEMYPDKQIFYHSFPSLVSKCIKDGQDVIPELQNAELPYILFFGRIEEYKGLSLLYDVFSENPVLYNNYLLVIAGSGRLPVMKCIKNTIIINRYIKDTEIANLYRKACCVVYPYISATQSGVLSLAFYFRTPVLVSDVPYFRDIVKPYKNGVLFKTGEKYDLEKKLMKVLEQDNIRKSICQKGWEYYQANFSGIAIRNNLISIYGSLMEKH